MFREGYNQTLKEKSPEQIAQEEKMREDAQNQFMFAGEIYSHFFGMKGCDDPEYGNTLIKFWTKKNEDGKSYSQRYREFVESDEFKNNPKFGGDIFKIRLEDFVNLE